MGERKLSGEGQRFTSKQRGGYCILVPPNETNTEKHDLVFIEWQGPEVYLQAKGKVVWRPFCTTLNETDTEKHDLVFMEWRGPEVCVQAKGRLLHSLLYHPK